MGENAPSKFHILLPNRPLRTICTGHCCVVKTRHASDHMIVSTSSFQAPLAFLLVCSCLESCGRLVPEIGKFS